MFVIELRSLTSPPIHAARRFHLYELDRLIADRNMPFKEEGDL